MISLGELLHGTDEDFLVNLYLAVLGRWPDEMGLAHHRGIIAGQPERRAGLVRAFLDSEEGRQQGRSVTPDAGPVPAEQALAAQLRLRTEALRAAIAAQARAAAEPPLTSLGGEILALGAALASLRTELTERIAGIEALLAGQVPPAPALSPAVSLDYVNDLVEAAQAQTLRRLRALELGALERSALELGALELRAMPREG